MHCKATLTWTLMVAMTLSYASGQSLLLARSARPEGKDGDVTIESSPSVVSDGQPMPADGEYVIVSKDGEEEASLIVSKGALKAPEEANLKALYDWLNKYFDNKHEKEAEKSAEKSAPKPESNQIPAQPIHPASHQYYHQSQSPVSSSFRQSVPYQTPVSQPSYKSPYSPTPYRYNAQYGSYPQSLIPQYNPYSRYSQHSSYPQQYQQYPQYQQYSLESSYPQQQQQYYPSRYSAYSALPLQQRFYESARPQYPQYPQYQQYQQYQSKVPQYLSKYVQQVSDQSSQQEGADIERRLLADQEDRSKGYIMYGAYDSK